jgi:hypothetical protein
MVAAPRTNNPLDSVVTFLNVEDVVYSYGKLQQQGPSDYTECIASLMVGTSHTKGVLYLKRTLCLKPYREAPLHSKLVVVLVDS